MTNNFKKNIIFFLTIMLLVVVIIFYVMDPDKNKHNHNNSPSTVSLYQEQSTKICEMLNKSLETIWAQFLIYKNLLN